MRPALRRLFLQALSYGKGVSHDAHGPNNERASTVIGQLLAQRLMRWRQPEYPMR